MSKPRAYSEKTLAIMQRFFEAFERCEQLGFITNVAAFCAKHSIRKPGFYTQRKDLSKGSFEACWLAALVDECGVSASWLLTGKGTMFPQ